MVEAQFNPQVRELLQHLTARNIASSEQPDMLPSRYGGKIYRGEPLAGNNPYYPLYHPDLAMNIHSGGSRLGHPIVSHRRGGAFNMDTIGKALKKASEDTHLLELGAKLAKSMATGKGRPRKHPLVARRRGAGFKEDMYSALHNVSHNKAVQDALGAVMNTAINGKESTKRKSKEGSGINNFLMKAHLIPAKGQQNAINNATSDITGFYNDLMGKGRPTRGRVGRPRRVGGKTPAWMKNAWNATVNLADKTMGKTAKDRQMQQALDTATYLADAYNDNDNVWDQLPSAMDFVGKGRKHPIARAVKAKRGGGARGTRAMIVKKVMAEHGLSLPQASSYVKQHGLY